MPLLTKNNKRILYIHVPKTAGLYIERMFVQNGWQNIWDNTVFVNGCTLRHLDRTLLNKEIKDYSMLDDIFMTIRRPIQRLVSEYKYQFHDKRAKKDIIDINEWVLMMKEEYDNNNYTRNNHLRPQYEFLISGAKIYRYENGFKDLMGKYKLQNIPMQNVSFQRKVHLHKESVQLIREWYKKDFEMFGYE